MKENKSYEFNLIGKKFIEQKNIVDKLSIVTETLSINRDYKKRLTLNSQAKYLKNSLLKISKEIIAILQDILIIQPLNSEKALGILKKIPDEEKIALDQLERTSLKRLLKKGKEKEKIKQKKPNPYIKLANKIFSDFSVSLFNKKTLYTIERDLTKSNLRFTPTSYVSIIMLTTMLSFFVAIFLALILFFFNISLLYPFISSVKENFLTRFLKIFWIIFALPLTTFLAIYFYPSAEKKSLEQKINQELPFAAIHMSAIGGSMVEPNKIFEIIASTKEYPALEKEFIKIINEINLYGYSLVSALRKTAHNTSSKKFAELLTSLATTITSGGDLLHFFDERAKSLLFEYRLEKEKRTKAAETFMDIYISAVIAAPMILMLLLMMMKMSGLGLSFSISTITLIIILSVSLINIAFLIFLQLKQSNQ